MTLTIGVDVGGTKIAAGVVDEEGRLLEVTRRETSATDPEKIETSIADAVRELRQHHDVTAIGVAAAGFVDTDNGIVLFAPNIAWRDEPLRADLGPRVGLPVVVENDANAAAWGEFRFGPARDVDDMVLITVGTGLGGGVVVDGRLLRGHVGVAGELGHVRMVPDGIRCGCGNRGCWEQYASGNALQREARTVASSESPYGARLRELASGDPDRLLGRMVTEAAMEGDAAAVELLGDLGRWLGEGMAQIAAVLDPALFVVGGGVVEAGDLLIEPARVALGRTLTARTHRPDIPVVPATLGNEAGMIGAADLARGRS
ncbi:MAG TPA: ROK family glucokinase [Actinomycetales bacterium]|nr:ROK family glucokinase [Actinomycetales bacterium]